LISVTGSGDNLSSNFLRADLWDKENRELILAKHSGWWCDQCFSPASHVSGSKPTKTLRAIASVLCPHTSVRTGEIIEAWMCFAETIAGEEELYTRKSTHNASLAIGWMAQEHP
jgi:hypothetical protein